MIRENQPRFILREYLVTKSHNTCGVLFTFTALLCFYPACFSTDAPTSGRTTNQLGERLILLKSGESNKSGLVSYGLYCVVSGSRAASNAPPGGDLVLVMRNNGAKWIDLDHVTVEDFSLLDAQGKQMKLYLWSSPRGMAYGDSDVFHLIVHHSTDSPQPWILRFKSKPKAFVPVDLSITGIEPRKSGSTATLDADSLGTLLNSAKPWPGMGTNYPRSSWSQLVRVAEIIQHSPPAAVEKVLHEYQFKDGDEEVDPRRLMEQLDRDSKLFLLMRIIFNLPEAAPEKKENRFVSDGWMSRWNKSGQGTEPRNTINLAWPITWQAGNPRLLTGSSGYQGQRYDAAAEYAFYQQRFSFRDLSEFKEEAKSK